MRKTKTCPKCSSTKILNITSVADMREGTATPARLAIRFEGHSFLGNEKQSQVGDLHALMCSECGYTEFYCANPSVIQPDGKFISWL